VLDAIFTLLSPDTRLIVVSHITSPTALTLPVGEICAEARHRGVAVCVDGPHALAQLPLQLDPLGCDFYTASCHKWLSAPLGSGFLYVDPRWHDTIGPTQLSWGRVQPATPQRWDDEFVWSGTRDYSTYLSVPAAIGFLRQIGEQAFRDATLRLARFAEGQLAELFGRETWGQPSERWYMAMAHVPLPEDSPPDLQHRLWDRFGIETPVIRFAGDHFLRVSCHLYNDEGDIERLIGALKTILN
jgi:isopenicillin-N epimerase